MKQLKCLRCGTMMVSMGTEKIQKGQATFFYRNLVKYFCRSNPSGTVPVSHMRKIGIF